MHSLDDIIEAALSRLLEAIAKAEPEFAGRLLEFMARLETSKGSLLRVAANDQILLNLSAYIEQVLEEVGVADEVTQYLRAFNETSNYLTAQQLTVNSLAVPATLLDPIRAGVVRKVVGDMLGQGLNQAIAQPLTDAMFRAVYSGGALTDLFREMRDVLTANETRKGLLTRHYIQVSRDAIGQYAGTANAAIADAFGLDAVAYVGSLVRDSRAQCVRWVGMEEIKIADLDAEIKWAYANGSGMIPGTTPSNFSIYRGGYNCRHEAVPLRRS